MPTATNLLTALTLAVTAAIGLTACDSAPTAKPKEVRVVNRDVPAVLRGTVGAEASLSGDEPIVMTGYGLVVGLNGTGSNDVPLAIRSYMIDQMTRMGVGKERGSLPATSPEALLDDPNVAVVLVQAVIPPGAPEGFKFDVRCDAVPGSSTRSLEGGTLWTTELRRGIAVAGGPATPALARVYGPIFTNPFAAPGGEGIDPTNQRTGFVLSGGTLTNPSPLLLILDNPSHSRARAVTAAVNARYGNVARGRSEDAIEITIPPNYRDRPGIFTSLLKHTRIDQGFPEEAAKKYTDALREQPELANELSWCLAALGESSLGFIRRYYNDPELYPRLAALQAGSRLGDLTTRPHLESLISAGPSPTRAQMIDLLADLPNDPKVNTFLRDLLNAPELDARVAAYDALEKRKDPSVRRRMISGKFELHSVPSTEPMIYITQSRAPRIVVFGDADMALNRPALVSAWDGRLMLDSPATGKKARVFYKSDRPGILPVTAEVDPTLVELIELFASKPSPQNPAPGLDLSYSQTVGALYQMVSKGGVAAPIVPEQDKIALEMLRARRGQAADERPELSASGTIESLNPTPEAALVVAPAEPAANTSEGVEVNKPGEVNPVARPLDEAREKARKKYVVPMPPTEAEKKQQEKAKKKK
jgi:hypothetical protein